MTDLQSVALATWLRSRRSLDRLTRYFELSLPNRDNQVCCDRWIISPTPQVGGIVVVESEAVNRVVSKELETVGIPATELSHARNDGRTPSQSGRFATENTELHGKEGRQGKA